MSSGRKKRLSMLDNLAAAGMAPPPSSEGAKAGSMLGNNRALRSARDAVDATQVWELDPYAIDDERLADRLDPSDVYDLRDAIEANGQTVPILVRRHPKDADRYLLVYGRRRLEAIRNSDKVGTVRALVAAMDDHSAMRAQISENMARRDLSFIEKALFARELVDTGFGNQAQVAEVLTVSKSAISMALAVVDSVTPDLARMIGPAHGVGRPRWETLAKAITDQGADISRLQRLAERAYTDVQTQIARGDPEAPDPSVAAFEAVFKAVDQPTVSNKADKAPAPAVQTVNSGKRLLGTVKRSGGGLRLDIKDKDLADWLEQKAGQVLQELHARATGRRED